MKKTVSIAIGGIVFHIEEDAYTQLSGYLDSVQRYFSAFAEGREIVQDIEARIAELFTKRLKDDDREAITDTDVEVIMATMGSVEDFAAANEGEATFTSSEQAGSKQTYSQQESKTNGPQPSQTNWQRSTRDKVVSGVFGGLAAKLGIDPLWLRVTYAAFFLGLSFLPAFPGVLFIGYLVLAVIMPKADTEAVSNIRKLYREPKGEIIGGVSGGLAAFLRLDVTLVRIGFVVLAFAGGAGIIVYLLLWALTTPASSMTDRLQMKGEPVTLSSINTRLFDGKNNLDLQEARTGIEKLLYLPFTIAGAIARAAIAVAKGLVRVFGAFIGIILIILALSLILLAFVVFSELLMGENLVDSAFLTLDKGDIDIEAYLNAAPTGLIWAWSILVLLVGINFTLIGLSLIAAKNIAGRYLSSILGILTVVSVLVAVAFSVQLKQAFKENASVSTTSYLRPGLVGTFTVAVPEVAAEERFPAEQIHLRFKQAYGDSLTLVQTIEGRGATRKKAFSAAAAIRYGFRVQDDTLLALDPAFTLAEGFKYQWQNINLALNVPEGKPFRLSEDARHMAEEYLNNAGDWGWGQGAGDRTFVFRRGKLECLDCEDVSTSEADSEAEIDADPDNISKSARGLKDGSKDGGDAITIDGELVDVSINKNGIETIVRDKETGARTRIRIRGDSITEKAQSRVRRR